MMISSAWSVVPWAHTVVGKGCLPWSLVVSTRQLMVSPSANFFSGLEPTAAFIFTLLSFAAGFAVRPFGALFFGRLGDMIGRKYTFLVTMTLMGLATFVVGLLPTYGQIGILAPIAFITCTSAPLLAHTRV